MINPKKILITGATSGLGFELAKQYAKHDITLYLTGRNQEKLQDIEKICSDKGATVISQIIDVKDKEKMFSFISNITDIDLVIANAGVSAGTGGGGESLEQIENIFDTNIYGVINTIMPAIENMKIKNKGQIAIISSMAGYRGLPSSPAYSSSKAAVKVYGEAIRGDLQEFNIGVTVITPAYIETPMTDVNDFPMPLKMKVEKAASLIIRKLKKNPARIAFPLPIYLIMWFLTALPPFITDSFFAKLPKKPSNTDR